MLSDESKTGIHLDAGGLFLAGLINTFLALFDAAIILGPGTLAVQSDLALRAAWIAEHTLRWQGGWLFWFAVTLSFSWSYFALGRRLQARQPWVPLAVGLAVIAAAGDIVGILLNLVVLPELAHLFSSTQDSALPIIFQAMEDLANALTNVAAFGLYSLAGLFLLPTLFTTPTYPRW